VNNDAETEGIRHFWVRSEEGSAALRAQGDSTARFYVGAISAGAAWFVVNSRDSGLSIMLILVLAVVGAGHATWYQLRALRLHDRAIFFANRFADLSGLSGTDRLYVEGGGSIWRTGHPITGAIFSGLTVLIVAVLYSIVLGLALPT
jgi:hypothetical protein